MVEQLRTPEKQKKGSPIHIVYGGHGEEHIEHLHHLDSAIIDKLESKKSGDVVVFVEDAEGSAVRARQIEGSIALGIPPLISIYATFFNERYHSLPDLTTQEGMDKLTSILDDETDFVNSKFNILDKHFIESGRIRLLWESRPDEVVNRAKQGRESPTFNVLMTSLENSLLAVYKGEFDKGLRHYKRGVEILANDGNGREQRLAEKISSVSQENNVTGIVGYIGSSHTKLGHLLSKKGHDVTRTFTEMEDGKMFWDTTNEATRRRQFFPNKKLSGHEWHRLMIGDAIHGALLSQPQEGETGHKDRDQKLIKLSRSILDQLQLNNMKQIREFERGVRQNGFTNAINRRLEEQQNT